MNSLSVLWARRALFVGFVRRDVATRYTGTLIGGLWAIGQPVLLLAIYAFVFRRVFRVELPDLGGNSFVAFVACALWPWMAFQESVQRGTQAIASNADLVRKIRFPYELLVLSTVMSSFVIHFAGFCGVLLALALWGEPFHASALPTVLAAWVVMLMLAAGVALATASLQVVLKDVDHLLGPLFMLLFYATPILYPLALVPESIRPWMEINPLLHVIEPLRGALLRGDSGLLELMPVLAGSALLLFCARWLFLRLSAYFEDFL
jgi:ABC-type polysaccharide/polyol phosphate export permease